MVCLADISPTDANLFVSGSCDTVALVWDVRQPLPVLEFGENVNGHESDINSVKFLHTGDQFVTGSDDSTCRFVCGLAKRGLLPCRIRSQPCGAWSHVLHRLFDLRAYKQLNAFSDPQIVCGITSVEVSSSGAFDVLVPTQVSQHVSLSAEAHRRMQSHRAH